MKEKRIFAFFIDCSISVLLAFLAGMIGLIAELFHASPKTLLDLGVFIIPLAILSPCYLFFRDFFCGGLSIGKRVAKIKMLRSNNYALSILQTLLYDLTALIWPLEAVILLLSGKTIGELITKIQFIE